MSICIYLNFEKPTPGFLCQMQYMFPSNLPVIRFIEAKPEATNEKKWLFLDVSW